MVSGGVFLVAVLVPYLGYKLYQRLCQCSEDGRLCFTRRRGVTDGGGSAAEVFRNFLQGKIIPKVELDFPSGLRAGQTVNFRVVFPLRRHRRLQVVQNEPADLPSLQESVYLQGDYNLTSLKIEILKESTSSSSQIRIEPVTEFLPRNPQDANATCDVLLVSFHVQEAGFYHIHVLYDNEHLAGSPFPAPFDPAPLDAEKTLCLREAPIILSVSAEIMNISVRPLDRFGNECNFGDVDPDKFHLKVTDGSDDENSNQNVDTVIFNFTREIKRRFCSVSGNVEEHFEVQLEMELFQPGVFVGAITYDGTVIQNGTFDIIVLSPDEHSVLREILNNNPGTRYQEAKLHSVGGEVQKKSRQVYVYISAKIIAVKEYYFGLIPSRVATYRVLPVTKFKLVTNVPEQGSTCLVSISDRTNPSLVLDMDVTSCRIAMAMFALFLKQRLGGSESFPNKQKFFYEELKSGKDANFRTSTTCIYIQRANLINSSLAETKNFTGKDWCRNFKIKFAGEEGSDDGGLRREWLDQLCIQMFENSQTGMFCSLGNSRLVHPNHLRDQTKWSLKHYELAGKVVGKCLFETAMGGFYKQMVNGRFTRSFLAQLIGFTPQYKYFEQDDPEYFLGKVKYLLENDVDDMELTFSDEEYNTTGQLIKVVDLIQSGKKVVVTNENKEDYLNALSQYRLLTRVKREIESFVKGLSEIVPDGLLSNFDENELEILMCGKSVFDVNDLKMNHVQTDDNSKYRKILPWFWTAVTSFTDDERGRLLQFVTGSSILPHGGFKELQPTFRITVYDTVGNLPVSHTCFNEICLSDHRSYEEFEKRLRLAISEGCTGFAMM
ncbi:Apoptosis-resistant E3 ubiquitin protein ligase 1 [Orchesella cincta]|uniref:HECT-type E3 ubiquitin transferase n=1 Tax=Orchesella cincta TaxID=48709 RepID=A0A1D2NKK6_ORCCI|nr:Apoptosis-resistant E3 ubiquitin protein ligase 1 [Orchesella cincta]